MRILIAVILSLFVLLSCDESGGMNEEVIGLWEHLSDSTLNPPYSIEYLPADMGIELETIEFAKDGNFKHTRTFADSVSIFQGTWGANYEFIDIEYEASNSKRYELSFSANRMRHAYSYYGGGQKIWSVRTYERLE